MEKSRIAVLVLLGVVAMIAGLAASEVKSCSRQDFACPDVGESCTGDFKYDGRNETDDCIKDKRCCAFPLICDEGKCVESTKDKECERDDDCRVSSFLYPRNLNCVKGKCVFQMSFNDSCREDDQCAGNQECMCDHKCDKEKNEVGRCSGLKIGDSCNFNFNKPAYECGFNSKCVGGVCKLVHSLGEDCEKDADCDAYSVCHNKKCDDPFTVKKGEACFGSISCEKGLYCDNPSEGGVCKEAVKREKVLCSKDEDCAAHSQDSTCSECDSEKGENYCSDKNLNDIENDCVSEMKAAIKCFRRNYCPISFTIFGDSCAQTQCAAETNAVFTCNSYCEDKKRLAGVKCVASILLRYCPVVPIWLRIVLVFSALVLIIIGVFIAYGIYRVVKNKKSGYNVVPSKPEN